MHIFINCLKKILNRMSIKSLKENVINWHQHRYPNIDNTPNETSIIAINDLCSNILLPLENEFGEVSITYGFTSHTLLKEIQKLNPSHIAPNLDQHASYEKNSRGKVICDRGGAACDLVVTGFETNMYEIARWAAEKLPFDRMYLYGNARPIHLSFGPEQSRFIQTMNTRLDGRRFPERKGKNTEFNSIIGKAMFP
ncbi:MAG: hypothetical protein MK214_19545 [Thalassotalea sp.]|nr:hypothetical protein [Thalassotalea sp.]